MTAYLLGPPDPLTLVQGIMNALIVLAVALVGLSVVCLFQGPRK